MCSPTRDYADLFAPPGVGRPSLPATQMAAVLALQTLHDFSDRETAEAVRFDVRWKVAIGLALDDAGFDPSSLVYWRRRIARSGRPHRVNDAVRKVVGGDRGAQGAAAPGGGFDDPGRRVATQDTVTQLVSAIRRVAREVPGGGGADRGGMHRARLLRAGQAEDRLGRPGRQGRAGLGAGQRRDRAGGRARTATAWTSGPRRRWRCWPWSPGRTSSPPRAVDGTDGRWRIARKVAEDRVISTVDPDARHTRKSPEARRDGYRAHVAADPETGIITDEKLTQASGTGELRPGGRGGVPGRRGRQEPRSRGSPRRRAGR